jgi:DDE superfamily endonuclease
VVAKKYGVNLQRSCDAHGRFLDVSISHPGSTSDFLAFSTSSLYFRLESGLLKNGICLFGDNAYVNTRYMATPFKAVRSGSKDEYNFYQLQLKIRVECAFGMLVNCWGILRRALLTAISFNRSMLLVMCLCRLQNFCITERLRHREQSRMVAVPVPLAVDQMQNTACGGMWVKVNREHNIEVPNSLLHGGHRFCDTS